MWNGHHAFCTCETVKENYLNNKDYKIIEIPDSP